MSIDHMLYSVIRNRTDILSLSTKHVPFVEFRSDIYNNRFDISTMTSDLVLVHNLSDLHCNPPASIIYGESPYSLYIIMKKDQNIVKHYDGHPLIINRSQHSKVFIVGYDLEFILDTPNITSPLLVNRASGLIDCNISVSICKLKRVKYKLL